MSQHPDHTDVDPIETQEWVDSFESVMRHEGVDRAGYLLKRLVNRASQVGAQIPVALTTPYRNTIPLSEETPMPGDLFMERRIRSLVRWNALAMVMRAGKSGDDLGGHIASYQSAATLYEIGFNYFWKGPDHPEGPDLIYYQATYPRVCTRAHSWKAALPSKTWITSAVKSTAKACLAIRTLG